MSKVQDQEATEQQLPNEAAPAVVQEVAEKAKPGARREIYDRLHAAADGLKERFIARDEAIDYAMMAALCGEHIYFLSPPGTAKSAIINAMAGLFKAKVHSVMMREDTRTEELLGSLDITALERGEYRRKYAKLATCDFAYINECFKGSSQSLNALLGVLNERHVEDEASPTSYRRVPLWTAMLDSNELPSDMGVLGAFFDRILFRLQLDYIEQEEDFADLLRGGDPLALAPLPTFTMAELTSLQESVSRVMPTDIEQYLKVCWTIRQKLKAKEIVISDRTWARSCGLLDVTGRPRPNPVRAHAMYMSRSAKIRPTDLMVLTNVLWRIPEERQVIKQAVFESLGKEYQQLNALLNDARDRFNAVSRSPAVGADGKVDKGRVGALSNARVEIARIAQQIDGLANLDEHEKQAPVDEIGRMIARIEAMVREARQASLVINKG